MLDACPFRSSNMPEITAVFGNLRSIIVRSAANVSGTETGPTIKLGKGITLRNGALVTVPFAVPLPEDAPPTAEAVHQSLLWFLQATLRYSKWTQGIEQVRRPIVVVNAP
jgi:hypothetical protein